MIELLKEDTLNSKFDLGQYQSLIKSLSDLLSNVEFKYIEKTEEEKANESEESIGLSITQQERQM